MLIMGKERRFKMKRIMYYIVIVSMVFGLSNFVMAHEESKMGGNEKGMSKMDTLSKPNEIHKHSFPVAVKTGDYDLLSIVLDFPPGSGFLPHFHGGYVLVTVLEGEISLQDKGAERKVKTGESWTENPGDVHSVINRGTVNTRVVAVILLPKGASVTTMSDGGQQR